jgi:hypothetical protein
MREVNFVSWSLFSEWLSAVANVAAIVTGMIAAIAGTRYLYSKRTYRSALEALLKRERDNDEKFSLGGKGERTILFLMANLAMTESQVLDAAFASRRVKRWLGNGRNGRSSAMFFQYDSKGGPAEIGDYMNMVKGHLEQQEMWGDETKTKETIKRE